MSELAAVLLASLAMLGSGAPDEAIDYASALDVATLDSNLTSQRLDTWLIEGAPKLHRVTWYRSDCNLRRVAALPATDRPLCVKFVFEREYSSGWGMLRIGVGGRISGKPALDHVVIAPPGDLTKGPVTWVDSLGEVPAAIRAVEGQVTAGKGTR